MQFYLIPLLTVISCWATVRLLIWSLFRPLQPIRLGFYTLQGVFPKYQQTFASQIGQFVATQFSIDEIKDKLASPEKVKAMLPILEKHIDTFLREKLPVAMPVLKMFIGDSTIKMMKDVLMKELDDIFPAMIAQYLENIELDLAPIVTQKIQQIPPEQLEKTFRESMGPALRQAALAGIIFGLITGLLQLALLLCC